MTKGDDKWKYKKLENVNVFLRRIIKILNTLILNY